MSRLREHIERVARNEPYMGEEIPVRWLLFEQAVQESVESGVHYLSLEEVSFRNISLWVIPGIFKAFVVGHA